MLCLVLRRLQQPLLVWWVGKEWEPGAAPSAPLAYSTTHPKTMPAKTLPSGLYSHQQPSLTHRVGGTPARPQPCQLAPANGVRFQGSHQAPLHLHPARGGSLAVGRHKEGQKGYPAGASLALHATHRTLGAQGMSRFSPGLRGPCILPCRGAKSSTICRFSVSRACGVEKEGHGSQAARLPGKNSHAPCSPAVN